MGTTRAWRPCVAHVPAAARSDRPAVPGNAPHGDCGAYLPRSPANGPLFEIVQAHLLEFLSEARRRSNGAGVPGFVEQELRDFLACGSLARGFARFRCDGCRAEILVPFACKGRAFCPSCCGRRMAELSMHLVDSVLGGLPIRQWVLTCPWRLRYAMAWDHRLCRAVLAVFMRAVLGLQRRRARRRGLRGAVGGAVTAIQRSGAALNLNVHFMASSVMASSSPALRRDTVRCPAAAHRRGGGTARRHDPSACGPARAPPRYRPRSR
jgi:hypothetical protein